MTDTTQLDEQKKPTVTITLEDSPNGCLFKMERHNFKEDTPFLKCELIAEYLYASALAYESAYFKDQEVLGGIN